MDNLSKEKRSWNMSQIKSKDTTPEILLRSILHCAGLRFRLHVKKLPGRPDIVLPRFKTVIFVNGCFWHHHTGCDYAYIPKTRTEFWLEKFKRTKERDLEKNRALEGQGWNVFTVWECEIKEDPLDVLKRISSFLNS